MLSFPLRYPSVLLTTIVLAACAAPPGSVGNSTCSTAIALTPGAPTRVEVFNQSGERWSCGDLMSGVGVSHYSVTIPPQSRAEIDMQELAPSSGTRQFYTLSLLDACPPTSCDSVDTNTRPEWFRGAKIDNPTDTPSTRFVVLEGLPRNNDITLEVHHVPLARPACEQAERLALGADPRRAEFDRGAAPSIWGNRQYTVYFSMSVPPRSIGRVAITDAIGPYVGRVIGDCESLTVMGGAQASPLLAQNTSDRERQFIVELVGGRGASVGVAHIDNIPPAMRCEEARILSVGDSITASTASATTTATCAEGETPQLFYSISIPAQSRATLAVRRTGGGHARVRLLNECVATGCPVVAETVDDAATTVFINNLDSAQLPRIVAVSGVSEPSDFTLDLVRINALPGNRYCYASTPIEPGQSITVDTDSGGGDPDGCDTTEGLSRYYSVRVPAESKVRLSLTRRGTTDMRLRVYDQCPAARCVSSTATSSSTPISLELRNENRAEQVFGISVGAVGRSTSVGAATLSVGPALLL